MDISEARTPSERRYCILEDIKGLRELSETEKAELEILRNNIEVVKRNRARRERQRAEARAA